MYLSIKIVIFDNFLDKFILLLLIKKDGKKKGKINIRPHTLITKRRMEVDYFYLFDKNKNKKSNKTYRHSKICTRLLPLSVT